MIIGIGNILIVETSSGEVTVKVLDISERLILVKKVALTPYSVIENNNEKFCIGEYDVISNLGNL